MDDADNRFLEIKRMLLGIQLTVLGIAVGGTPIGLELGGLLPGLILLVAGLFITSIGYK